MSADPESAANACHQVQWDTCFQIYRTISLTAAADGIIGQAMCVRVYTSGDIPEHRCVKSDCLVK